jgi:hypothetical protein
MKLTNFLSTIFLLGICTAPRKNVSRQLLVAKQRTVTQREIGPFGAKTIEPIKGWVVRGCPRIAPTSSRRQESGSVVKRSQSF